MSTRSVSSNGSKKNDKQWAIFMGDLSRLREVISNKKQSERHSILWKCLGGIDAAVRGVGQVVFANNPVSGLLIIITLGFTSPNVLLFGSTTGFLGLVISYLIQDPGSSIENGLTVYNPLLIGIVTSSIFPTECSSWDRLTMLMMFSGTIFSVILARANGKGRFPVITFPFNVIETMILIILTIHHRREPTPEGMIDAVSHFNCQSNETLITESMINTDIESICKTIHINSTYVIDWGMVFRGIVTSSSQVFAVDNVIAGTIIYLAILIYSPTTALFSLIGAIIGSLSALGLGVPHESVYSGLWGYNSLLLSCSFGGIFLVLNTQTTLLAFIAAIFTVLLQYTLNFFFLKMSLSVLTIPFVATCYLFISVRDVMDPVFPEPMIVTFPEKHRAQFQRIRRSYDENESPQSV
ncbi:urea transporter 2-like isoform X2 [Diachasmimorpha longicaudata]|uniref:urea transporter 2-like isoform X2 n=1 Tax=Diachasmimorpha longicaudata TaxID=58733 RepID=UPI0030B869A1